MRCTSAWIHGDISSLLARSAEQRPAEFFAQHPPPVVIDEVQYGPAVFRHIKADVDANRAANGRYVLSGSQKFPLMKGDGDGLEQPT